MAELPLSSLSSVSLLDLGAQLEDELATAEATLVRLSDSLRRDSRRLLKPGTKLTISTCSIVGGLFAAPATFGLSLVFTVAGAAVTAWDAIDYRNEAVRTLRVQRQVRELRTDIAIIKAQLDEILRILELRFPRQ